MTVDRADLVGSSARAKQPDPNAFATYQVSVTHREYQALQRLRQLAKIGKQLVVIELAEGGPYIREVGKRDAELSR